MMYPVISNIINEGVKQLNNIKNQYAESEIYMTYYDKEVGLREYILKVELQRKQGQEVFEWVKGRIVMEQKNYQSYLDDIFDLYESFRSYSNSMLKPMKNKVKAIALLEVARKKWMSHLSNEMMKIAMLKEELGMDEEWPKDLGLQKWVIKKTSSKILAELPELTEASVEYRKLLKQNGLIYYLKDCVEKENRFLKMLPTKVDKIEEVKAMMIQYLSV